MNNNHGLGHTSTMHNELVNHNRNHAMNVDQCNGWQFTIPVFKDLRTVALSYCYGRDTQNHKIRQSNICCNAEK